MEDYFDLAEKQEGKRPLTYSEYEGTKKHCGQGKGFKGHIPHVPVSVSEILDMDLGTKNYCCVRVLGTLDKNTIMEDKALLYGDCKRIGEEPYKVTIDLSLLNYIPQTGVLLEVMGEVWRTSLGNILVAKYVRPCVERNVKDYFESFRLLKKNVPEEFLPRIRKSVIEVMEIS